MNMDGGAKPRSPVWTWVGCGCGLMVALTLAAVVTITWLGYRAKQSFEADMKDPVAREARSQTILGYDELPAGYHAAGGFELPFVVEMAMLTDRDIPAGEEVDEDSAFGDNGFVFLKVRGMDANDKQRLESYLEGQSDETNVFGLDNPGVDFEPGEVIRRGRLPVAEGTVRYVAQSGRRSRGRESIFAVIYVECASPPNTRQRMGVWFEAVAETPNAADPYAGTPADEARLAEFLGHFKLCR